LWGRFTNRVRCRRSEQRGKQCYSFHIGIETVTRRE
jgi:hypothetical protein